jgi:TetR/AcrR family transcriptional regulator, cholesterol catabolism regulator
MPVPDIAPPQQGAPGRARAGQKSSEVIPLADMTSGQLVRRAKILEEVIDLIADVGADAVQMRDVAQRSSVALATVYRYFSSKEHLLAAALEEWQKRLTRRILAGLAPSDQDPLAGVLDYLRRAQRAFHRNPEMTALMLQRMTSTDPEARASIDRMDRTNVEMFNRLLEGAPSEEVSYISFGLNAALIYALNGFFTGKLTLDESLAHVEWIARAILSERQAQPRKQAGAGPHKRK